MSSTGYNPIEYSLHRTPLYSLFPGVPPLILNNDVGTGLQMCAVRKFHVRNHVRPKTFHCLRTVVKGSRVGIMRIRVLS